LGLRQPLFFLSSFVVTVTVTVTVIINHPEQAGP